MLTKFQYEEFRKQGYVVVPNFVSDSLVEQARKRFEPLFRGEFETGIQPMNGTGSMARAIRVSPAKSATAGKQTVQSPALC